MKEETTIKTKTNNTYFYDTGQQRVFPTHPILHYLLELNQKGTDLETWMESVSDGGETVAVPGYKACAPEEIRYYYQKYLFLRSGGFFAGHRQPAAQRLSGRLTADQVETNFYNAGMVVFEVAEACNLRCAYCAYGDLYAKQRRRQDASFDLETAKRFLTGFLARRHARSRCGTHTADGVGEDQLTIGFYGGEPLLNMHFIKGVVEFLQNASFQGTRFHYMLTTNGLLLEKHMNFLAAENFRLAVSLDGDEAGNAYRVMHNGAPAFNKIMKNLEALRTKYPDYFNRRVNLKAVLHNKNSVASIHDFFKRMFAKEGSISELSPDGVRPDQKEQFRQMYANVNESLHQVEDYGMLEKERLTDTPGYRGAVKFVNEFGGHTYGDYNRLRFTARDCNRCPTATCRPFDNKIFITAAGDVLPCEYIDHRFALGNIGTGRWDPECNSIASNTIAARYNAYYDKITPLCAHCYNQHMCNQCIFYLDWDQPKPRCHGFMTQADFSRFLGANMEYLEGHRDMHHHVKKENLQW